MKAWIDSVDAASKEFAERRMNEHVAQAIAGRRVEDLASGLRERRSATDPKAEDAEDPGA